jgi:hypothetical protein
MFSGEANEIGNANLRIKLNDGETNCTIEDNGDRKSVEHNTKKNSAENVTGSRESTSQQKGYFISRAAPERIA